MEVRANPSRISVLTDTLCEFTVRFTRLVPLVPHLALLLPLEAHTSSPFYPAALAPFPHLLPRSKAAPLSSSQNAASCLARSSSVYQPEAPTSIGVCPPNPCDSTGRTDIA